MPTTTQLDRYIWWAVGLVLAFGALCGFVGFLAGVLVGQNRIT